ncbi:MAG: carboxylating nicotinate-nucleotide diphosphorylase [Flavobacteriales bacterium]|jgi:nicotinate-nucleotide pyrophosphorylase (carboxylating)|tara:strand:+ start:6586 stop:7440 length:855 start_codon:yes stop_codon:yes gene_type:complete
MIVSDLEIQEFIKLAIDEDIKDGDHSSLACIPATETGKAKLLVKQKGILAGVELAEKIFNYFDPTSSLDILMKDGEEMKVGDIAFYVSGNTHAILKAERLVLNCMQRMSAVATRTNQVASKIADLKTKVLDTRKTTPLLRFLEKWAVRIGGGVNHRFGLYDMIMLKDNHIDYAGGIKKAITKTNQYLKDNNKTLKIEIETRNLEEVKEVLFIGNVDRIMLDNFSYADIKTAVALIDENYETEASGGITIDTVRQYAECGVDFVSMGALTHSVKNLDLSLKAVKV